jgi:microsomal dipeptidase-like Zn-dependent dipeptidase
MEKSKTRDALAPAKETARITREMKAAGKSDAEISAITGITTTRTDDVTTRLKQAGLTDAEIKKLRGGKKLFIII